MLVSYQYASINNQNSSKELTRVRVAQGSILYAYEFSIFKNETCYADDAAIIYVSSDHKSYAI